MAGFGGRYLVRGGDVRHLEGNFPLNRLVVLEFPTVEAAQHFYDSPEYQPILQLRLREHAIGRGAGAGLFGIGFAAAALKADRSNSIKVRNASQG